MNNLNELLSKECWMKYLELATEGGLTDGAIANDIVAGIEKAINYNRCSTQLRDKKDILIFSRWLRVNGYELYSRQNYQKDNELIDKTIIEVKYKKYIISSLIA